MMKQESGAQFPAIVESKQITGFISIWITFKSVIGKGTECKIQLIKYVKR